MAVSPGLQRKFDTYVDHPKIQKQLEKIEMDIDSAFKENFFSFRSKLLGLIEDNPVAANDNVASKELKALHTSIKRSKGKYNENFAEAIIKRAA